MSNQLRKSEISELKILLESYRDYAMDEHDNPNGAHFDEAHYYDIACSAEKLIERLDELLKD